KWTRPGRGVRGTVLDGGGTPASARGASRGSWASFRPVRTTKPGVTAGLPPRNRPAGSSTAREPRPGSSPPTRTPTRPGERARVTRRPHGLVAVAPSGDRPSRSGQARRRVGPEPLDTEQGRSRCVEALPRARLRPRYAFDSRDRPKARREGPS